MKISIYLSVCVVSFSFAQNNVKTNQNQVFKDYWYSGKAEITSYDLEQERYGEMRTGKAVNIFVTEPFSKAYNTKADQQNATNVNVLKLNSTKNFNTGIYPYSIMTSTFLPIDVPKSSLKISSSTQEWCGQEYIELKNTNDEFVVNNSSYFQGKSFQDKVLNKDLILEHDIWSKIRLTPNNLPQGDFTSLPSFVYLRFSHKQVKGYPAQGKVIKGLKTNVYQLIYPILKRTLSITFENTFPYKIIGWTEVYESGWGANKKKFTTKTTAIKTLNIAYWQKNSNADLYLRKELGLE